MLSFPATGTAKVVTIASAANFKATLNLLTQKFASNDQIVFKIITASSGTLFAQIHHGAPFDIYLSANTAYPKQLSKQLDSEPFIYALGQLVFWMPATIQASNATPDRPLSFAPVNQQSFKLLKSRLAIANPKIAPYGKAAQQVIKLLKPGFASFATANNINQAFLFTDSGNTTAGLVALSQMNNQPGNRYWLIPSKYYSPIEQGGILLTNKAAAVLFVNFLHSEAAQQIIRANGYLLPASNKRTDHS
ncbi:MAG: molybdate ABC transporter substrate-binding protein [Pseudomonadales bacterium]|nr:molybdate ABC transporter substrate-binding protein [Pseudomonadales bacterium]